MMLSSSQVVLITGAGKRVGATVARYCHQQGLRVAIHYRHSAQEAEALCDELNQIRTDSAFSLQADLAKVTDFTPLIQSIIARWERLDVLINNASNFYATPIGSITLAAWDDLFATNLKAPLFLSQAAAPYLKTSMGCIINMVDIQAQYPLKDYTVYCLAKAGLVMLTKSLARELGPNVRVNGIAPGIVLWPDEGDAFSSPKLRERIVAKSALKRAGTPEDIAQTIYFLINQAPYITGQIITVDGGRSLVL